MTTPKVRQLMVTVNAADLPVETMDLLKRAEIHTNLGLPGMFSLTFHDEGLELVESTKFPLGSQVIISTGDPDDETSIVQIFSGDITAIEPDFNDGVTATLTIRGYDPTHKMNREVKTQTFINVKDSDIVNTIVSSYGISKVVDSTRQTYDHVFQNGQTDLAFLHMLARRNGFEVFVNSEKLYFRKPAGDLGTLVLEWGVDLKEFHPRLSAANQVNKVLVHGWDVEAKRAIVGQATSSSLSPSIGYGKWGGQAAQSAFRGPASSLEVRRPVANQGEADILAQALLDQINSKFIEAEGVVFGNPECMAGKLVDLKNLGDTFSGKYIVTSATHIYTKEYYETIFTVEGGRYHLMSDYIDGAVGLHEMSTYWNGVVPALVTNNDDPKSWGRVKVKFPWLSDTHASDWARIAALGAGANRGSFWVPEVNDEVLVAFEHGDFSRPYVLGGLWNGSDAIPDAAPSNGAVNVRTLQSRTGHVIRFDDTDGGEKIEIIDKSGSFKMIIDSANKNITIDSGDEVIIKAGKDITIDSGANITLKAVQKINLEATGDVMVKGLNVKVNAQANLELKATAMGNLEATGILNVKGSLVKIN